MKIRKIVMSVLLTLIGLAVGGCIVYGRNVHQHCMKGAALGLRMYASEHGGKFPFHTNGFGDALLLFAKEEPLGFKLVTGPGDDGELFKRALTNPINIPEEQCSRIYVQGLSESNNPSIVLLFDRHATRGGDHRRSPFAKYVREVGFLDGAMQVIRRENWPEFAAKQIELLVAAGFPQNIAEGYYSDTLPKAKTR
jgi:hypothetical protein